MRLSAIFPRDRIVIIKGKRKKTYHVDYLEPYSKNMYGPNEWKTIVMIGVDLVVFSV